VNISRPVPASTDSPWRLFLAGLLTTTAVIHLAMTPVHFEESTLMGLGFIGAGVLQLGLAAMVLLRPRPTVYLAVALASIMLVGLYCANVTVGLPWAASGPHEDGAGHTSAVAHGHDDATDGAHVDGGDGHHDDDEGDAHRDVAHATEPHGHTGIQIGSGEPVDAVGGANLAAELASAGVAIALLRRRSA